MTKPLGGRCLCGAVSFEIGELIEGPVACHCRECQRQSGGAYWVAVSAPKDAVKVVSDRLGWVRVSQRAWRGFCRDCGGYIFWQSTGQNTIDIAFGTLDDAGDMPLSAHIFTAEARLPVPEDGVPRFERGRPSID